MGDATCLIIAKGRQIVRLRQVHTPFSFMGQLVEQIQAIHQAICIQYPCAQREFRSPSPAHSCNKPIALSPRGRGEVGLIR